MMRQACAEPCCTRGGDHVQGTSGLRPFGSRVMLPVAVVMKNQHASKGDDYAQVD